MWCSGAAGRRAPALADAIQRLIAREDLRRDYAGAARRHAEQLLDLWRNGRRLGGIAGFEELIP